MRIAEKVFWITGASSGIGEALAYELSLSGAKLILSARNAESLARVQQNCLKNTSFCEILPLDLANSSHFIELAEKAITFFGSIDILINNGGISQRSLAAETPMDVDRKIMEVDYFGTIALTKAVIPHMVRQQGGHIVVVSSVVGKFGFPLRSAYAAAKHALHGFFESLRSEIAPRNINITLVCPGRIKTNISYHAITKDGREHGQMDPGQAKGIPADVCAKKIIAAVKSNKKEIYIARGEKVLIYLKRYAPALFYVLVKKIAPK